MPILALILLKLFNNQVAPGKTKNGCFAPNDITIISCFTSAAVLAGNRFCYRAPHVASSSFVVTEDVHTNCIVFLPDGISEILACDPHCRTGHADHCRHLVEQLERPVINIYLILQKFSKSAKIILKMFYLIFSMPVF